MTQVKICGLTRVEDVALACELGAFYVGFVFAAGSQRRIRVEDAPKLSEAVRPGVARVGVFVNEEHAWIDDAVQAANLDLVQIHRPLRPEDLESIRVPVIAVARVQGGTPEPIPHELLARCRAILLDGPSRQSGAPKSWDWGAAAAGRTFPIPFWVAGGLDPDNVGRAIDLARPAGVDVASGIESAPGHKDPEKLKRFFRAVADADERGRAAAGSGERAHAGRS